MKTITEFSGTVLRLAASALHSAKAALPPEPPPAEGTPAVESEAAKAAIEAAISKETGISGDRLARLREALSGVGDKIADVRLVRVYTGEEAVPGAKKIGEHQYVVDVLPQSMKPQFGRPEKDKHGGRGGDRGGGRGAGGPGSSAEQPITGGFSMDSIKSDRGGGGGGKRGPGGPKR